MFDCLFILLAVSLQMIPQGVVGSAGALDEPPVPVRDDPVLLSGTVTDARSNEPIPGVAVYLERLDRGTVTDSAGVYRILVPAGEFVVQFRFLGMTSVERHVVIHADTVLDVQMQRSDVDLDEVLVEATRFEGNVRGVGTGVEVVRVSELAELPAFFGEVDVVSSVELLPGVNSVGEGSSGFNVRGGRVDQNLILMDGAPLFNASHVAGLFSVFNPDVTEGYALYKGHMPARYGGRLSSVMDVSMRQGSMQEYRVAGAAGLGIGRLMVEGPIIRDRTSVLLAGRITYFDWILSMASRDRQLLRIPLSDDVRKSRAAFYDANASISHRLGSRNLLTVSAYGSDDHFRYSDDFGFSWTTSMASFKWRSSLASDVHSELSAVVNSYSSSHYEPSGTDAFRLENGIRYYRLRENVFFTGLRNHIINVGAEWTRYESFDETIRPYHDQSTVPVGSVGKDQGRETALYAANEMTLSSNVSVSLGLRYSAYSQMGPAQIFGYRDGVARSEHTITDTTLYASGARIVSYQGFEPRLSSRIMITPSSSVKLGYDRTRQYVHQISNNTSAAPSDIWQVSTRHLPPQTAHNFSVGYYRDFRRATWETSLEVFYRGMENLVEYVDFAELYMNEHIETELVSGLGRAYGAEVSVNKTSGRWAGWLSYSFSRTFVRADDRDSGQSIAQGEWYPSNHDQPHNVVLAARRRLGLRSSFSISFAYRTGRPITGLISNYLNDGTAVPIYSSRNRYRIPDYLRLDISVTIADNILKNRTPNPERRYRDSLSISLYNVLGRRNAYSVFYDRPAEADVPRAYRLSVLGAVVPGITYNFSF